MIVDIKQIAPLVERQFPAFYKEEGEDFIQFVKSYYEWMDSPDNELYNGGPLYKSRILDQTLDIDETSSAYLNHYTDKYLHGIPRRILGNRRLLAKHILDFYRSKGSIEGLKLLFRFLYKQEINVYVPESDMLRPSDGKWVRNRYLEVTNKEKNYTFQDKFIKGTTSGAVAYVDSVNKIFLGNQVIDVFYLTNITTGPQGYEFLVGEHIKHDDIDLRDTPTIMGSPIDATVTDSSEDWKRGDRIETTSESGENIVFVVKDLYNTSEIKGYLRFTLKDGGQGYTTDSPVHIEYLTATTGSGANYKVGSIKNPKPFTYNTDLIKPIVDSGLLISAVDYGAELNYTDVNSALGDALSYDTIYIGSISKLIAITSGDHNYNGSVNTYIKEARVYGYGIQDQNGRFWGNNAIITGLASNGNGVIKSVQLISSGLGFNANSEVIEVYGTRDPDNLQAELQLKSGAVGKQEGYWDNTDGFLNSDKFIQDSDYYQEYSYEIQIEKSLDKYIDILKKVMHPAGNKPFGKIMIKDINTDEGLAPIFESIVQI